MADRVFGITIGILSLLFLFLAVPSISGDWQSGADARYFTVGPRLFPYVAGSLTLCFGILIALRPSGGNAIAQLREPAVRNNVLKALAIALFYVAFLDTLGFTLATVPALLAFLLCFGERRWIVVVSIAVGVPLLIKQIFLKGFALELPVGVFEFPW